MRKVRMKNSGVKEENNVKHTGSIAYINESHNSKKEGFTPNIKK